MVLRVVGNKLKMFKILKIFDENTIYLIYFTKRISN